MASNEEIKILITAEDKASGVLSNISNKVGGVGGALQTMAKVGLAGAVTGFAALGAVAKSSFTAFAEAEATQTRLTQILRTTNDATDEQIKALLAQADALEKVGVVSGDAITAAQGTLATFDLQTESIERLIPSFLNMVVAEKGVNATTDDMIGLANGLGKVLQGQVGALSKQGFVFDEVTEKILKFGTEEEKIIALSGILDSTYEGLNETMRGTAEGGMKGLQMSFGKLQEIIGATVAEAVTPFVTTLSEWAQEPETQEKIQEIAKAVAEFAKQLAPVVQVLIPALIKGLEMTAKVGAGVVKFLFQDIPNAVGTAAAKIIEITGAVERFIMRVEDALRKVRELISSAGENITNAGKGAIDKILPGKQFRAAGGSVSEGSPYIVGERGAELFVPQTSGRIMPNGSFGGGSSININISGSFLSESAAEAMANMMMDKLKLELRI